METMVRRFKSDFRYLHVFVILFKQDDNRLTSALRDMLEVFQSTFGPEFWRNVILEATHWSYSPGMVRSENTYLTSQEGRFRTIVNSLYSFQCQLDC